jgi:hypothetical protein
MCQVSSSAWTAQNHRPQMPQWAELQGSAIGETASQELCRRHLATILRSNWQPNDHVSLVFHAFKPVKNIEADAVKAVMSELGDFDLDYAFLHVADHHPFLLFDHLQKGVFSKSNSLEERRASASIASRFIYWCSSLLAMHSSRFTTAREALFGKRVGLLRRTVSEQSASLYCDSSTPSRVISLPKYVNSLR